MADTTARRNYIENIAIVGAGGHLGFFIVAALLNTGKHRLTAITRKNSTSTLPAGLEVKKVDYDDPASLTEALRGQDALVITLSAWAPPDTSAKLIAAAAAAGVPWVLPNDYVGDPTATQLQADLIRGAEKSADHALLERLGVSAWVGVTCGFWYEWSLGGGPLFCGFDFKARRATFFGEGTQRINFTTWPQIARGVASLLSLKVHPDNEQDADTTLSQFRNKPVYIASFLLSQRDMLDSVLRVTGTKESEWTIVHEAAEARYAEGLAQMQGGDMRGFLKLLYSRTFYPDGCGDYESRHGLHNEMLGLPVEDLDEFTRIAVEREPVM